MRKKLLITLFLCVFLTGCGGSAAPAAEAETAPGDAAEIVTADMMLPPEEEAPEQMDTAAAYGTDEGRFTVGGAVTGRRTARTHPAR